MNETVNKNSICEACGKDFSCGAPHGNCWCIDVELSSFSLSEIREKFDKCLCFECLIAYTSDKPASVSNIENITSPTEKSKMNNK